MSVRRGLAAAADSLSQSFLRRRQLQEEKTARAENLSMQLGPQFAQLGQLFNQGNMSPEQALAALQALRGPLEAAGAKIPDFDLTAFAPSADTIAGPVRESLTPDTTTEQIVAGLRRRPGGERLTQPAFGPMAQAGPEQDVLSSTQYGPVQNPEVEKLEREVGTLGQQEQQAARRQFDRAQGFEAEAFPAALGREEQKERQAQDITIGNMPRVAGAEFDAKKRLALDPAMRTAAVEDQIRVDTARQQLEQEYGPVRPSESLKLPEDLIYQGHDGWHRVAAGTEGIVFYDYSGKVVGFLQGTPTGNPRQMSPFMQRFMEQQQGGINGPETDAALSAPGMGLSPEETEALRNEMRRRGLVP